MKSERFIKVWTWLWASIKDTKYATACWMPGDSFCFYHVKRWNSWILWTHMQIFGDPYLDPNVICGVPNVLFILSAPSGALFLKYCNIYIWCILRLIVTSKKSRPLTWFFTSSHYLLLQCEQRIGSLVHESNFIKNWDKYATHIHTYTSIHAYMHNIYCIYIYLYVYMALMYQ